MDAATGISPSMETIAAGMAGFALASLFSFARKPQIVKQESLATYNTPTSNSNFPGMGHDFHILARLVAEKQRHSDRMPRTSGTEESMSQILKSFQPQLAEFSSFEWHANLTGQSFPNVSEVMGRSTHMTYGPSSQSQGLESTKLSNPTPSWSQSKNTHFDTAARSHEAKHTRCIENTAEEFPSDQRDQRNRKRCRRSDDARRRGWGWCRGRDDDTEPTGRDWRAPRDYDNDDGWGWSRYRQERYN